MAIWAIIAIVAAVWWVVARIIASENNRAPDDGETPSDLLPTTLAESQRRKSETSGKSTSAPVLKSAPITRWLTPGEAIDVQGFSLPDGMLYVGQGLAQVTGHGIEPALVNPALPVARTTPDRLGAALPYWPSYAELSPQSRAAFLDWVATGRRAPDIGIGYVFLFLYGIERRTLVEAQQSEDAKEDFPAIRREVEALLEVYGANRSFERYATQMLDFIDVMSSGEVTLVPTLAGRTHEMPLGLRVGLGRLLSADQPIPAPWALAWLMSRPQNGLGTPSKRCAAEFRALFTARYTGEFGAGMVVKPPRSKLSAVFRPASASFGGTISLQFDVPDVERLTAPISKLQSMAKSCEADIEAFSRWVGRNPDSPRTLAAIALLPQELVANHESVEVQALWTWLGAVLKSNPIGFCDGEELLKRCVSLWGDKLTRTEAVLLAQLLQKGGYGLEPDARFGGGLPAIGEQVVVFQLEPDAPSAPSPGYAAAATMLHLAVAVSAADESVSQQEREQLEAHVERNLSLSDPERRRLSIHLAWLMRSGPRLTGLRKRLEPLEPGQRAVIADFVVNVAAADGHVSPSEVKAIEKIFGLLGVPREQVYSRLHANRTQLVADDPLPVVIAGQPSDGFTVPAPPSQLKSVPLDMESVAAKIAQSAKMAAVLNEIFTDGAESTPPTPEPLPVAANGLSAAYNRLLTTLSTRGQWTRAEFEALVDQHKLLPDAALEALNEVAFERCDNALLEGEDPIEVNPDIAKELMS